MQRYLQHDQFNRESIEVWQRNPSAHPVPRRGFVRSMVALAWVGALAGCGRKGDPQLPKPAAEPADQASPS